MSEKKSSKMSLSGLTKGSSSGNNHQVVTSFRFTPDSDSVEAIMTMGPGGDSGDKASNTSSSSSPASSPKPWTSPNSSSGGGDVSPIKEYFRKEKHKWAHKWDKKSLSLDLDIKGKFKTAFEDKTKSILSNFIPEERGEIISPHIPTSHSIPEHLTRVYCSPEETISNNSNSSGKHGSQETLDDISPSYNEEVEIGIEMLGHEDDADIRGILEGTTFFLEPEDVVEHFNGLPTLYQPLSLLSGARTAPFELAEEQGVSSPTTAESSISTAIARGRNSPALHRNYGRQRIDPRELRLSTLIINILNDIVSHPFMRFWILFASAIMIIPSGPMSPFLWFMLGCLTMIVLYGATSGNSDDASTSTMIDDENNQQKRQANLKKELLFPFRSQGWMTQLLDLPYNPDTCHFRQQKICYVRIDGHNLYLLYPNSKHRIPKRRMWNDHQITEPILFDTVKIYDVSGAEVKILPEGLAKNRVWNRKYPIGIKFKSNTLYTVVKNKNPEPLDDSTTHSPVVNYTAGTDGDAAEALISTNTSTPNASKKSSKSPKNSKDISRQDCSLEVLYLFARCDREKDDWFRRFVMATKGIDPYLIPMGSDHLKEYRAYMKNISPSLALFSLVNEEGFDNVSLIPEPEGYTKHRNDKDTKPQGARRTSHYDPKEEKAAPSAELSRKSASGPGPSSESSRKNASGPGPSAETSRKNTPAPSAESYRKSAPFVDKDLIGSPVFDFEDILSVPQSPAFLNAFLGRLFYDFRKSALWNGEVTKLVEKKLRYLRKPGLIDSNMRVKDLNMGDSFPKILKASPPILDHQGLWIDLDLVYVGNFHMSIEARVNFLKAQSPHPNKPGPSGPNQMDYHHSRQPDTNSGGAHTSEDTSSPPSSDRDDRRVPAGGGSMVTALTIGSIDEISVPSIRSSHIFDPDADDSGESSEDDYIGDKIVNFNPTGAPEEQATNQGASRFVDRIVNTAIKTRFVTKFFENVASTAVILAVDVTGFTGTLTINIPSPPNDRVWLGFRTNPDIQIVVKPVRIGNTNINISQLTSWIKSKLLLEIQRAVVCPNMLDISIPLMEFSIPK